MTIETYVNDLLNEHSINQQYNHADLNYTRNRIETSKEILDIWKGYELTQLHFSSEQELGIEEYTERKKNAVMLHRLVNEMINVLK